MLSVSDFRFFYSSKLSILLALLVLFTNAFSQVKTSEVYKKIAPSIVLIRTNEGGGSGFIVSANGLVLTALHVVDSVSQVSIKTQNGTVYKNVSLLAKDEDRDLALLKIDGSNFSTANLSNEEISPGDEIIVLGNPLALEELEVTISTGILSGIRNLGKNTKVLQITAPISPGNSGGPVLSESGNVIGVVSFKITKGESLNFAIPIIYAQELIKNAPNKPLLTWSNNGSNPFEKNSSLTLPAKKPLYNLTGYWSSPKFVSTYYIKDDGQKVTVWNGSTLIYDGKWEGDFVLTATTDFENREILKPIDSTHILFKWMLYKEKGGWEKILEEIKLKASKLTIKSATDIWTRTN